MDAPSPAPVLLLDVDGVLNGLAGLRALPEGWRQGTWNGYVISWDPTVTARLRAWHDEGRVAVQWLTTWGADADRLLAGPFGLPAGLPTHVDPRLRRPAGAGDRLRGLADWWKLGRAREVVAAEPDRRVVWIDDDLAEEDPATTGWLADHPQVLTVAPDVQRGLTHEELDRVESWLTDAA